MYRGQPRLLVWPQISGNDHVSAAYPSTVVIVDQRTGVHLPPAQTPSQMGVLLYCCWALMAFWIARLAESTVTTFSYGVHVIRFIPQPLPLYEEPTLDSINERNPKHSTKLGEKKNRPNLNQAGVDIKV
jgi:hypothetical protein